MIPFTIFVILLLYKKQNTDKKFLVPENFQKEQKKVSKMTLHITRSHPNNYPFNENPSLITLIAQKQQLTHENMVGMIIPRFTLDFEFFKDEKEIITIEIESKNPNSKQIVKIFHLIKENIHYFRIGEGKNTPFDKIWDPLIKSKEEISKREVFFASAVTEFILKLKNGVHIFNNDPLDIEFIHIHGAANGLCAPSIQMTMGTESRPTIIYSLFAEDIIHDYLIFKSDIEDFGITEIGRAYSNNPPYMLSLNKIALSYCDSVIVNSISLKRDLMNGNIHFLYRDDINEFNEKKLFKGIQIGLPSYFQNFLSDPLDQKRKLFYKKDLKNKGIIKYPQDLNLENTPLIVFTGSETQRNGIAFFPIVVSLANKLKFKFIVFQGLEDLNEIATFSMSPYIEIIKLEHQKKYYYDILKASDFIFDPSLVVGIGLNVIEAKLFGNIPICSKVGVHKDIVIENGKPEWNGYMFDVSIREYETIENIKITISQAMSHWKKKETTDINNLIHSNIQTVKFWDQKLPITYYLEFYKHTQVTSMISQDRNFFEKYYSKNLVKNPDFNPLDTSNAWMTYFGGFEQLNGYIKVLSTKSKKNGATQIIYLNQDYPQKVLISGFSKASFVQGNQEMKYSIHVNVIFKDQSEAKDLFVPFSGGTHDWELKSFYLTLDQPIEKIILTLIFEDHSGIAYFKDISVQEEYEK